MRDNEVPATQNAVERARNREATQERRPPPAVRSPDDDAGGAEGPCPNCGAPMNAIRGSKQAICANCGFKDSCCF